MSSWTHIPPAFILAAGAVILPLLYKKWRSAAFILFPLTALFFILSFPEGALSVSRVMNYDLTLLKVDKLSRIFGIIFSFICAAGGIYAFHIKETGQQCAALLYAAGALGVTFAGDFFTLFIFWEMMAVASTYLIWARRTEESARAGLRYLLYHVLGGGLLLTGILLYVGQPGASIEIAKMSPDMGPGAWLMLLGVVINAAVPPLHTWLSDAYPKATITGAVFLSAFTTKTAVYVLARVFPGWEILLIAGAIMTVYGVIYAVLANNIRSILAYHIISQVGYMVAGIGIGSEMAINGATAHAFSHILYKALLFMGVGAVLFTTGKDKLTDLGGLKKVQPVIFWLYLIAGFSISGVPLFNGFISKSMTLEAAAGHSGWAFLLMSLAAVGTFLSVGIKLPYYTWLHREKPEQLKAEPAPRNMIIGMSIVAFFCIFHGLYPQHLYQWLPFPNSYNPFTLPHFVEEIQLLTLTFIIFWLMRKYVAPKDKVALDLDWFYRKPAKLGRIIFVNPIDDLFNKVEELMLAFALKLTHLAKNPSMLFSSSGSRSEYTPDRYRISTEQIVSVALGIFAFIIFISLVV